MSFKAAMKTVFVNVNGTQVYCDAKFDHARCNYGQPVLVSRDDKNDVFGPGDVDGGEFFCGDVEMKDSLIAAGFKFVNSFDEAAK